MLLSRRVRLLSRRDRSAWLAVGVQRWRSMATAAAAAAATKPVVDGTLRETATTTASKEPVGNQNGVPEDTSSSRAPANENIFPSMTRSGAVDDLKQSRIPLADAVHIVRACSVGYPNVEVSVHLQCDPEDASIRDIRGTSVLPYNFLNIKTLVLATGEAAEQARKAGADIVGGEELIPLILEEKLEFDRLIATPSLLKSILPLARVLGPRGLMPTAKKGTLTDDVASAIQEQACAVLFKADVNGFLSAVIGTTSLPASQLEANVSKLIEDVKAVKKGKKSQFVTGLDLQAANGPAIPLTRSPWGI